MLFAAGFGTRMGALTADRPKPLLEVAGRALIDHALALAASDVVTRKVVNLHYRPGQIRAHLAGRDDIDFSHEAPDILETGGGLRHALPLLGPGPVFALNTDAVWTGPNPLETLAAGWDPDRMDGLLLLVPRDRAIGHAGKGDFDRDAEGRLRRGLSLVYTGCQLIGTDLLATIPEAAFSLNRIWDAMVARGRLFGIIHPGDWCDVGRPESLPLANAMLGGAADV